MTPLIKDALKLTLIVGLASTALSLSACRGETTSAETLTAKTADAPVAESALRAAKHVDVQGAYALLSKNPNAVVLDVRTPKEIAGGYIEGAVFADFFDDNFTEQLTKLDRDTPYLVHCKSGGRSTKALTRMSELGFTNITHMDGGLDGWKRENLPLTRP